MTSLRSPSPSPPARRPWEWSFGVALLVATVWVACFCFPWVWSIMGIGEGNKPFLDLRNLVAAWEAVQRGLDPYVGNPLDPYGRPHGFSSWWLVGASAGWTRADIIWLGPVLIGSVLLSAVLLTRPTNARQSTWLLSVLISPPLLFAINRANHDLVVFVLMGAALACLRSAAAPWRALGVLLLAVSAVLKYFPLAAAIMLLEARTRRELLGWILLYGTVLLLSWPSLAEGFQLAARHTPAPNWLFAFGAPMIFRNAGLAAAYGWLAAVLVLLAGAVVWRKGPTPHPATTPEKESPARQREFACGAIMVVGCFLHGSSYLYKLVFALWMLPWIWQAPQPDGETRWWRATRLLLLLVLWFEGTAAVIINLGFLANFVPAATGHDLLESVIFISQLLTWGLVICLWRPLWQHLLGQARRLGLLFPARLSVAAP